VVNRVSLVKGADWLFWKIVRIVFGTEDINGMPFLDLRALDTPDQVPSTLADAMETLKLAARGHEQLVRGEVAFVAATRETRPRAPIRSRAYLSPFTGPERHNSQLLAARLVWAATLFREAREARMKNIRFDLEAAERRAVEEQRALVEQLPNADRWSSYLHLSRDAGDSYSAGGT